MLRPQQAGAFSQSIAAAIGKRVHWTCQAGISESVVSREAVARGRRLLNFDRRVVLWTT